MSQASFLERVNCPVLVEASASVDANDNERAFRTEYVSLSDVMASRAQSPGQREVLLIKKREGALFSGHIGVGRTPNLDICIPRHGISKFHAYFSVGADGNYQLTDKDSKNGTFVGGTRLTQGVPVPIPNNTEVRFAAHVFRFMQPIHFYELIKSMAA
ncbi:MAG TPA: FHA domain-containing protein [Polyangiales bacterium]